MESISLLSMSLRHRLDPVCLRDLTEQTMHSDEDDFAAVMQELDERLKVKAPSKSRVLSSCFEGQNGLPVVILCGM